MRIPTDTVVRFPCERIPRAAPTDASWWDVMRERLVQQLGRLLRRVGVPGAIQNIELADKHTGQQVSVHVGELYVRLTVNGRDFYFNRFTGHFDGTGSATV